MFLFSNGRCDPSQQGFGSVLLKALLDNMPLLPAAATGGMYTMFVVIELHSTFVVWHVLLDSCEIRIVRLVQTASWSGLVRWYPRMKCVFVNVGILSKLAFWGELK